METAMNLIPYSQQKTLRRLVDSALAPHIDAYVMLLVTPTFASASSTVEHLHYLQQFEPRTEIPDEFIFGKVQEKGTPPIYHEQEIIDLLAVAKNLGPSGNLCATASETLFGLIVSA
jgi:hypothetical protein